MSAVRIRQNTLHAADHQHTRFGVGLDMAEQDAADRREYLDSQGMR